MGRAKETAGFILLYHASTSNLIIHIEFTYTTLLREKGGGVLEGMPGIKTYTNSVELGIPYREYRPDKGESWCDLMQRAKLFLKEIASNYIFTAEEESKEGTMKVLGVTHGGFIMEFLNVYRESKGMEMLEMNVCSNTAIYVFHIECLNCKGVCKDPKCTKELNVEVLISNDSKHLIKI